MPWSARQIALEAGLSPAWVSRAKREEAHKITLETAQAIHEAIDRLGKRARPDERERVEHPGLDAMEEDKALMETMGFTKELMEAARSLSLTWTSGPNVIQTKAQAVEWLAFLKARQPRDAGRS